MTLRRPEERPEGPPPMEFHMSDTKTAYVLVTTSHRGVFAGELVDRTDRTVVLRNARCAIRWGTTGGFLELAASGPNRGKSKVGAKAPEPCTLYDVTSVTVCSEAARTAWEQA